MKPADVKTEDDVIQLTTDNWPRKFDVWSALVSDRTVSIHAPNGGSWVEIPHDQFREIAEWYLRDQTP